ncbi:hypothetical protein CB1_000659002 [Camelus ferus]|nr:hypothetical protein CB1_000659002 [Camelus ferus]
MKVQSCLENVSCLQRPEIEGRDEEMADILLTYHYHFFPLCNRNISFELTNVEIFLYSPPTFGPLSARAAGQTIKTAQIFAVVVDSLGS